MQAFLSSTPLATTFLTSAPKASSHCSNFHGTRPFPNTPASSPSPPTISPRAQDTTAFPYTGSGYGSCGIPYAKDTYGYKPTKTSTIPVTLSEIPIFKTLVSLLAETNLEYELSKAGPFTLFAPTDQAFGALLEPHSFTKFAGLLRFENRDLLKDVLAFHVIRGKYTTAMLKSMGQLKGQALNGEQLSIMAYNRRVTAGGGRVIKADVPCSNGVVHVVNCLLTPMSYRDAPKKEEKKVFFQSTVLDRYKNTLTPREALGIDPLPQGYDGGALARLS